MFEDHAPKPASGAAMRARKLRKEMSLPEVLLWRLLRGQPQGVKFRRQHPSGELSAPRARYHRSCHARGCGLIL